MGTGYHAFISHSTRDRSVAQAVCQGLEAAGIRCWIAPRNIEPGREYPDAIVDGIEQSRTMVLIFSSSANESRDVRREVKLGSDQRMTIIPLRIEDVKPVGGLEYFLGSVQWLDALPPHPERALPELAARVRSLLDLPADRPGPIVPEPVASGWGARRAAAVLGVLLALAGGVWGYRTWGRTVTASAPIARPALASARQHLQQGVTLASMKEYEKARIELTKAIEIDGGYAAAYANRGVLSMQQRRYDLALQDLKMAEALDPQDRFVAYNLAALYSLQNQPDRGLAALGKALDHGFDDFNALRSDPDLANLRRDPEFPKLLERHKVPRS